MTGRRLGIAWIASLLLAPLAGAAANTDAPPWWLTPQRMIQTNLREIDATMDIDQYLLDIKAFGANVIEQSFDAKAYTGETLKSTNVIAQY